MRFVRGRSTPAIRAIAYPCLCLCFALVQITRTTPRRRTTLHLSQIRLTDALTFMSLCLPCSVSPVLEDRASVRAVLSHLPDDPAARQIPRRELNFNLVPDQHSYEVPIEPAAE